MGLGWWFRPYDPAQDAREKAARRRDKEREKQQREAARAARPAPAPKPKPQRARRTLKPKAPPRSRAVARHVKVKARPAPKPKPAPRRAPAPAPAAPARPPVVSLAVAAQAAHQLTAQHGTFTADQLAARLSMTPAEVSPVLARLQASGKVRRLGSGFAAA